MNPVSQEEMYMFVTEDRAVNEHVDPGQFATKLRDLLAPFPAPLLQQARVHLEGVDARIVFRPLESLLMPRPWHRGRVLLVGDAEELGRPPDVEAAFAAVEARRWERCRMVVENSGCLADLEITGGARQEHANIMRESLMALAQPI